MPSHNDLDSSASGARATNPAAPSIGQDFDDFDPYDLSSWFEAQELSEAASVGLGETATELRNDSTANETMQQGVAGDSSASDAPAPPTTPGDQDSSNFDLREYLSAKLNLKDFLPHDYNNVKDLLSLPRAKRLILAQAAKRRLSEIATSSGGVSAANHSTQQEMVGDSSARTASETTPPTITDSDLVSIARDRALPPGPLTQSRSIRARESSPSTATGAASGLGNTQGENSEIAQESAECPSAFD